MSDATPAAVRRALMDLLARREHSERELLQKASRRFPDSGTLIAPEIERLRDEGLQSDRRMAESFVRARVSRGQGPLKISAELRGKGVSDELIQMALDAAEVDWETLAREVAHKRFGEELPLERREKARWVRFLQQRGFAFDHFPWIH